MDVKAFLLLFQSAAVYSLCSRHHYYTIEGRYYTENVLAGPTADRTTVADCRRVCLLDSRCFAYQMRWTDAAANTGYCETISFRSAGYNGSNYDPAYTLYALCPWTMLYFQETDKCYLFAGGMSFTWDDGWSYCQSLHPEAHLMDIQSEVEQQIARQLAASSTSTWIGGRRYSTGVYDFGWVHTNTTLQQAGYQYWKPGEPTDPRDPADPADCIRLKNGNQWFDSRCTRPFDILCEI